MTTVILMHEQYLCTKLLSPDVCMLHMFFKSTAGSNMFLSHVPCLETPYVLR